MNDNIPGRNTAIVAYLSIVGTVIALFMNNEDKHPFASFHIRQALGIFVFFFLLGYFVGYIDSWTATLGFWVFVFILWLYGFITALSGQARPVPFLGEFFQKIFKSVR